MDQTTSLKTRLTTYLKNISDKFSVKKLRDDLDYWIFIGIGDDIVRFKNQRLEYKHLVDKWIISESLFPCGLTIPQAVLCCIENELTKPWYKRPTFWHLVRLQIKRLFGKL